MILSALNNPISYSTKDFCEFILKIKFHNIHVTTSTVFVDGDYDATVE